MRNNKLRLWCIVLAVAMLLVALPVTAMAADEDAGYDVEVSKQLLYDASNGQGFSASRWNAATETWDSIPAALTTNADGVTTFTATAGAFESFGTTFDQPKSWEGDVTVSTEFYLDPADLEQDQGFCATVDIMPSWRAYVASVKKTTENVIQVSFSNNTDNYFVVGTDGRGTYSIETAGYYTFQWKLFEQDGLVACELYINGTKVGDTLTNAADTVEDSYLRKLYVQTYAPHSGTDEAIFPSDATLSFRNTMLYTEQETCYISNSAGLVEAIKNQKDGQTWVFTKAGTYDAKNTAADSNGTYKCDAYAYPFAFPIHVDNLTIKKADGVGEVTITSSYEAETANWHDQNFITVYGDGLTIDGVNIKANQNTSMNGDTPWYDNLANKAIEFTADSSNFTLKNMKLIALENKEGQRNSGSIWVGCNNVGSSVIENVEMASFISGTDYDGNLTVTNLTQDYTAFNRAGVETNEGYYLCGIRPTSNGTLTVSGLTVRVDNKMNLAEQVFSERLPAGSTVELAPGTYNGSFAIDKSITIQGANAGVAGTSSARGEESVITGVVSFRGPDLDIVLDGLKFEHSGNGNYTDIGVINGPGGHPHAASANTNLTVKNCVADIVNNYFVYTQVTDSAATRYGTVTIEDNWVKVQGNYDAFNLWGASKHIISGNLVEDADNNAFNLDSVVGDVTFTGNEIRNVGGHGLQIAFFAEGDNIVIEDNIFTNIQEGSAAVYIYGEDAQIDSQLWVCRNTVTGDGDALDFSNAVLHDKNSVFEDNTLNGELVNPELSDDAQKDFVTVVVKDGKTVLVNKTVSEGTRFTLPEKPSKKGYTFLGWKSSADREVYKAEATVKIYEDTTFTAQWMSNWEIVDDVAGAAGAGKEFFTDVKAGDWYYAAVKFVFDNNLMDGVGDGKFDPDSTLTRAMIAQVLYNLEGETRSYPSAFDDVKDSAWYADAVNWAAENGIVEGKGNGKFDPNAPVTRQEMAAILYRYAKVKGYDVSGVDSLAAFTDASKVASWAKEPMGWAVENYVINGKGNGKLDPTGTATRAEVAQILMNLCNNVL